MAAKRVSARQKLIINIIRPRSLPCLDNNSNNSNSTATSYSCPHRPALPLRCFVAVSLRSPACSHSRCRTRPCAFASFSAGGVRGETPGATGGADGKPSQRGDGRLSILTCRRGPAGLSAHGVVFSDRFVF